MSHWVPTHVQVTVIRAKNLIPKSKNGETNNAYVTIQLGKEKFETSVLEKTKAPEWNEECDLRINDLTGSIVLSVYHKHTIGTDDFLGRVELPLPDVNFYERPKNLWFPLRSKKKDSNKEEKYRGDIQVRLNFYVQNLAVSVPNLIENGKKERSSFRSTLSNLGKTLPNRKHHGSVMDVSSSPKSTGLFSSLSRSHSKSQLTSQNSTPQDSGYGSKPQLPQLTPDLSVSRSFASEKLSDDVSFTSSIEMREPEPVIESAPVPPPVPQPVPVIGTPGPVIKSSSFNKAKSMSSNGGGGGTLPRTPSDVDIKADNTRNVKVSSMTIETKRNSALSDGAEKSPKPNGDIFARHHAPPPPRFSESEPVTPTTIHVPKELMRRYGHLEKGDLIAKLADAEQRLGEKQAEVDRMQTYIESLLLRVMDTAPKLLQTYPSDTGTLGR